MGHRARRRQARRGKRRRPGGRGASGHEPAIQLFAPGAIVVDEGRTYRGTDEVLDFLRNAGSEFSYTTTLVGYERTDDERWTVRNRLEGDFPGGVAELGYRFTLDGARITELVIACNTRRAGLPTRCLIDMPARRASLRPPRLAVRFGVCRQPVSFTGPSSEGFRSSESGRHSHWRRPLKAPIPCVTTLTSHAHSRTTGGALSAGLCPVSTSRIYASGGSSVAGTSRRVWRILQTSISSSVTT